MSVVSKNVYNNKLDKVVDKDNKTFRKIIKIKPTNVHLVTYIEYGVQHNDKDPKFSVGDHVRLSNYKKSFLKGYTLSWSEEVLVIKKVKITVPWISIIIDLNGEEIDESELQKNSGSKRKSGKKQRTVTQREGL